MSVPGRMLVFPLMAVSGGHLVADMYLGGFPVLFPMLQQMFSLSYAQIGVVIFLAQFSSSVLQPVFGLLSDKFSHRSVLQWSLALAAVGFVCIVFAPSYAIVLIGTTICGIGVAAYHPEASKLAVLAGRDRESTAMSAFAVSGNLGLALGPVVMTLGFALFGGRADGMLHGALIYVPITLLMMMFVPLGRKAALVAERPGETSRDVLSGQKGKISAGGAKVSFRFVKNWPTHYRWMALLLVYIFIRSTAQTGMQTLIPLYFEAPAVGAASLGSSLLTVFLLGGAFGTVAGGLLADKVGMRPVIVASFLFTPALFAFLPYAGHGPFAFLLLFAAGFTLIASFSLTTVMGQRFLPDNVGLASGLTLGFSVGTGGLGAALLGVVADKWGLKSTFWVMAALMAVGLSFAFALPSEKKIVDYFARNAAGNKYL